MEAPVTSPIVVLEKTINAEAIKILLKGPAMARWELFFI